MLSRKLKTKKIKKFTTKLIFCWCCPKYTQQRFQNHLISKKVQMYFVSDIYVFLVFFYIFFHAKSKTARYKSSPDESISQTKTISTFPQFLTPRPKNRGPFQKCKSRPEYQWEEQMTWPTLKVSIRQKIKWKKFAQKKQDRFIILDNVC